MHTQELLTTFLFSHISSVRRTKERMKAWESLIFGGDTILLQSCITFLCKIYKSNIDQI